MKNNQTKKCTICNIEKNIEYFHKSKRYDDGRRIQCAECVNKHNREYKRSKEGLIRERYSDQVRRTKRRGHSLPSYSKEELVNRFVNDKEFVRIYNEWVENDYKIEMSPSFDRKRNRESYTFDNIKIVTYSQNTINAGESFKKCEINREYNNYIPVCKYSKENIKICEYGSLMDAQRETGINERSISKAAKGVFKQAGGFIWKFVN